MSIPAPPRPEIPNLAELPLVIDTPRLQLRPIALSDVDDLYAHASDPEVARMMSWNAHADRDVTREYVERQLATRAAGTDLAWAIVQGGRAFGCIALVQIEWAFRAWRLDRAELGYWMGRPMWGQGYMTEAATAATRWAFETLGLHKVTIGCVDGNHASKRVIEKIGFRYLSTAEDDVWRDGRWWSHLHFEMTAAEWADTARTLNFNRPRPPT